MPDPQIQSLLDNSKLLVVVPSSPIDDVELLAKSSVAGAEQIASSALEALPQREVLFLDEIVNVFVVLQSPGTENDGLEGLASQLSLSLECFAVGMRRSVLPEEQDDKTMAVKDLVCSWTNTDEPGRIYDPSVDGSANLEEVRYVLWKAEIHISRARIRSSKSFLYFSATAIIPNESSSSSKQEQDEYLPSGVAESFNLFDSLRFDSSFKGNPPVLPASRLSKILPAGVEEKGQPRSLRTTPRAPIRLVPAFTSRVRYSRVGASPNHAKILPCLHVDISPSIEGHVELEKPQLSLSDGFLEALVNPDAASFPLCCKPRDSLSLVYIIKPNRRLLETTSDKLPYTLDVLLNATLVTPKQTSTIPLKSSYRLSIDHSRLHPDPFFIQSPNQPAVEPPIAHLITATISSPPTTTVGETLIWTLLIANRSETRTLNLAIIPITHAHPSSTTNSTGNDDETERHAKTQPRPAHHAHKATLSTSLFTPSGRPSTATRPHSTTVTVTATAHATATEQPPSPASLDPLDLAADPSLIAITPDIRTGALAPGASASAAMRFLVLRAGVVRVLAVRVVDLGVGLRSGSGSGSAAGGGGGGGGVGEAAAGDVNGKGEVSGYGHGRGSGSGRPFVDLKGALLPDVFAYEAEPEQEQERDVGRDVEEVS